MQLTKSVYEEFSVGVYCRWLKKWYTGASVFLVCMEEV